MSAITKHYQGDDSQMKVLMGGILQAFAGQTVEEYSSAADAFLRGQEHPTLDRAFHECGYVPMIDLLRYLEANGFTNYIASGGDRDFMRPVTGEIYGIPAERVIGSSNGLAYVDDEHGGSVSYLASMDVFDDGPVKPVRIWSRIGRRPILAGGNSNGDIPMLRYAGGKHRPALRLLVLHDDHEREFAYTAGAEDAARDRGRARLDGREHEGRLGDRLRERLSAGPISYSGSPPPWLQAGFPPASFEVISEPTTRKCTTSSALGQCSTPRGMTSISPGPSVTSPERSCTVSSPLVTTNTSS